MRLNLNERPMVTGIKSVTKGTAESSVILRPERPKNLAGESGFVLALAMMLMLILTFTGMGFLQLDFLEHRMVTNEKGNHDVFYLANAGIERSRTVFKIPDSLSWTTVLNGADPNYLADANPSALLCPFGPLSSPTSRGCVIPPFQTTALNPGIITANGGPVVSPNMPFDGTAFFRGQYTVRAYNNNGVGDAGTTDGDQSLTLRALGTVGGEKKLIQMDVRAISGTRLINCQGASGDKCPEKDINKSTFHFLDGRDPQSFPEVPMPDFKFYSNAGNFPWLTNCKWTGTIQNNCYYSTKSDISITTVGTYYNVVIHTTKGIDVKVDSAPGVKFFDSVLIAEKDMKLHGGLEIHAPLPLPAIVDGGKLGAKDAGAMAVNVYGALYGGGGTKLDDMSVEGIVIVNDKLNVTGTYTDNDNLAYYDLIPGFIYPKKLKATKIMTSTWKEIEAS